MSGLLQAIGFLTVLPVPRRFNRSFSPAMVVYFPLVGLLMGALVAGVDLLLAGFGAPLRAILVIAVWLLVSGALHLDGWIDVCDALAPGLDREAARRARRDPRAGAMGVAGAIVLIGIKWAALAGIAADRAAWIAVAATASRWATSVVVVATSAAESRPGLMVRFRSAVSTEGGGRIPRCFGNAPLGSQVREGASAGGALASTALVLPLLAFAPPPSVAIAMVAALVAAGLVAVVVQRRLGELPGDAYGAGLELAEAAVLVVAAYGASA